MGNAHAYCVPAIKPILPDSETRHDPPAAAETAITRVQALDPEDGVGGSVIAALVAKIQLVA